MKIVMPGRAAARRARRASASAATRSSRSRAGAPSTCSSGVRDGVGDLGEADPAVEERRHRNLVGRVVRAREGAAALPRLARQRQQRERLVVRRLEPEVEPGGEIERLGGDGRTLRDR